MKKYGPTQDRAIVRATSLLSRASGSILLTALLIVLTNCNTRNAENGISPLLLSLFTEQSNDSSTNQLNLNPNAEFSNTGAKGIAVGGYHACALTKIGGVRCWGSNANGGLGYGNLMDVGINQGPSDMGNVDVGGTALQVVAGDAHTCALLTQNRVRCWGRNDFGQLGLGHTQQKGHTPGTVPSMQPPVQLHNKAILKIVAGGNFNCVLYADNTVFCWGHNNAGQLGRGNTNNIGDNEHPGSIQAMVNLGGTPVVDISAGYGHVCVKTLGFQTATCWGYNAHGELGRGHTNDIGDNEQPVVQGISLGEPVTQIEAYGNHTCALLTSGRIRCWGNGQRGRLGYGNSTATIGDNELPSSVGYAQISGEAKFLATASPASEATCAYVVSEIGAEGLSCWGASAFGSLGFGTLSDIYLGSGYGYVPHGILSKENRVSIGWLNMCLGFENGQIKCGGFDGYGAVGDGAGAENIGDNELMSAGLLVK